MNKFLGKHNLLKLTNKQNLKMQINILKIEYVILNFPTEKTAPPYGWKSKLFQKYNEKHLPSILNAYLENSFMQRWAQ